MALLLFYVMAFGAVAGAIGVITAKNPIASVLSLLASFFFLAVIYLLVGYQFMAAIQLLVYAGAIMVLFLFVIMLLNLGQFSRARWVDRDILRKRQLPVALAVAAALFLPGLLALGGGRAVQAAEPLLAEEGLDHVPGLAEVMFSKYLLPFEAASVLLLAAAVAVLVLAKRQRRTESGGASS